MKAFPLTQFGGIKGSDRPDKKTPGGSFKIFLDRDISH